MATILDTFITKFRWDVDDSGLKQAERGMEKFESKALGVLGAVAGFFGGGLVATSVAKASAELLKYADGLGIAVEAQGEMDFAAAKLGVNLDTLHGQLFTLSRQIGEAARGEKPFADDLEAFGLSAKDAAGNTKQLLPFLDEVRKKYQTLGAIERTDLVDKLGFDEETVGLLSATPEAYAALTMEARRLGVTTRQEAESAKAFGDAMINIGFAGTKVANILGGMLFPALAKVAEITATGIAFLGRHVSFFKTLGIVIGVATVAWTTYRRAAILAQLATFAIPAAIAAAVAAIALLSEDVYQFFRGQDSLIGKAAARWPALGNALFTVRGAVLSLWESITTGAGPVLQWFESIGAQVGRIGSAVLRLAIGITNALTGAGLDVEGFKAGLVALGDLALAAGQTIIKGWSGIGDLIQQLITWIADLAEGFADLVPSTEGFKAFASDVAGAANSAVGALADGVKGLTGKLKGLVGIESEQVVEMVASLAPPAPAQAGAATAPAAPGMLDVSVPVTTEAPVSNSTTVTVEAVNIDAKGADSREIAANVGGELRDQLRNASRKFDSTVAL